jgi:hypothetical protein
VYQGSVSYACFGLGSPSWQRFSFTLAAAIKSNSSRTSKRVWGSSTEGATLVCFLRKSRSSHIWRLCRISEGLSFDYG